MKSPRRRKKPRNLVVKDMILTRKGGPMRHKNDRRKKQREKKEIEK